MRPRPGVVALDLNAALPTPAQPRLSPAGCVRSPAVAASGAAASSAPVATGAGAVSRFDIGMVIATGMSIGTLFTLFVLPCVYTLLAAPDKAKA